jgi:hypothetical protein
MINWYQQVHLYSRHLSRMMALEVTAAFKSQDPASIKKASSNLTKVLQTIGCGCFSLNIDVASLCMRTLMAMALDLADI